MCVCISIGGYFTSRLKFPSDFPNNPPKMTFTTPNFWHPNVYNEPSKMGNHLGGLLGLLSEE